MGQDNSKVTFTPVQQQLFYPTLCQSSSVKVVLDQSNHKMIQYEMILSSLNFCKIWEKQVKNYFEDVETNWFYLPVIYHFKKADMCGSSGILSIYYQYFPITLSAIIDSRHTQKISQPNIWKVLYTLCASSNELHAKNKRIGKFSYQHILFNSQGSEIKIATGLSFFTGTDVVGQVKAPELNKQGYVVRNDEKQQSFCIGFIVMCCMLLFTNQQMKALTVDVGASCEKLVVILRDEGFYEQNLRELVISMCSLNPSHRISPKTFISHFKIWEGDIMMGNEPPTAMIAQILRQNRENILKITKFERVTLNPNCQQQQQQEQSLQQKKDMLQSIQQASSECVSYKGIGQKIQYDKLFAMVDSQLQSSRKSFR